MKVVLLAAGEGVRLLPLTATRPKHLIKVGGKPILHYCLEAVKKAGEWVELLTKEMQKGEVFEGKVKRILPFGYDPEQSEYVRLFSREKARDHTTHR